MVGSPAHARRLEPEVDEPADGALHDAGPDGQCHRAELGVLHVVEVSFEVVGFFVDGASSPPTCQASQLVNDLGWPARLKQEVSLLSKLRLPVLGGEPLAATESFGDVLGCMVII